MKVVITVVGVDRTGIIAAVSQIMAENKVNILTINQVILDGILFHSLLRRQIPLLLSEPAPGSKKEETLP